jgi:phage protein D
MASKTTCVIRIDGNDVSSDIDPYLTRLTINDKAGTSSDTCEIELDDRDGVLAFPRDGVEIEVLLGNENGVSRVFSGTVDEVKSKGDRSGGMMMTISGKGVDTKGKAKEPKQKHWDNKPLSEVMTDAGKAAGLETVTVAPELGKIKRPYIAMQNESFLHFGQRIAREVGGTFKISGKKAIIAERNGGKSASGQDLPAVTARRPGNLISWDIAPVMGRGRYKEVKTRSYDPKTGKWTYQTEQINDDSAKASFVDRYASSDPDEAKERAKSHKKESERAKGGGSVTIDGSTDPQPEALLTLTGAKPGVDGTYRIESVQHTFDRSSGWTTQLDVKQPQGEAGKDSRASAKKSDAGKKAPTKADSTVYGF